MPFLALGVEHKTAPLSVRERVAIAGDGLIETTQRLATAPSISEVTILSTCNRTEIYVFTEDIEAAVATGSGEMVRNDPALQSYLQIWREMEAVEHLFRVASGLESQLLGEAQILSQIRETLDTGQRLGTIGTNLHSLFRAAISCARQARAATALGRVNLSLGDEAVRVVEERIGTLRGRSILLIGGGEISNLVASGLQSRGLHSLFIANRTTSIAEDLAQRYGGQPVQLTDISRLVPHVDAIISATGARHYVLTLEDLPSGEPEERDMPLQIVDLAIPRDVDPAIGALEGIELHDLDSLLPAGQDDRWVDDVQQVERIIADEIQEFMAWCLTRRVVPVIASLRSHVEAVSRQEMKRVAPQLTNLTKREQAAVESLTQRLIDKMFHHLVTRLRLAAQTDPRLVDAAEFFFLHGEGGLFEHAAAHKEETEPVQ